MRNLIGLALLFCTGCVTTSPCSLGWRFEIGRAPYVTVPAMISPQSGSYMVNPVGAYPSAPPAPPTPAMRMPSSDVIEGGAAQIAAPARRFSAPVDPCSCDVLLRRLDSIDRRLDGLTTMKKLPE
jgi:hypothetical protein